MVVLTRANHSYLRRKAQAFLSEAHHMSNIL